MAKDKDYRIPVYSNKVVSHYAFVDAEDLDRFSGYKWSLDERQGAAYRDIKPNGKLSRLYLHREVLNCKIGDGTQVHVADDNKLNCRKSNLSISDTKKKKSLFTPSKFFPRKTENFVNYVIKHFDKTDIANFISLAEIETFNTRQVVFRIEETVDGAAAKMQARLQEFFDREFGYKGKIHVYRQVKADALPTPSEKKMTPSPTAVIPAPVTSTLPDTKAAGVPVRQTGDVMGFLSTLGSAFGLGKDTSFEFINFGLRKDDEIHSFRYERSKITTQQEDQPKPV